MQGAEWRKRHEKVLPRLVIFNLNSTLADAGPRYAKAFCCVCEDFGLPVPMPIQIEAAMGEMNLAQIMAKFVPNLPSRDQDSFMQACNRTRDALLNEPGYHEPVYEGLTEALGQLAKKGIRFGLCSNIGEAAINAQIEHYGLDEFFPGNMRRGKVHALPQPTHRVKSEAMHYLAKQHVADGGCASPMISIGDSITDYSASTINGFGFIGFARDEASAAKMRQAGISVTFFTYAQLPSLAERMLETAIGEVRPIPALTSFSSVGL